MKKVKKAKKPSNVRINWFGEKKTYCWDIAIRNSRTKKDNVQHFPREVAKECLRKNQKEITIRDVDLHVEFKCTIKTTKRMGVPSPSEKYMTQGWYNYVNTKRFANGDTLLCQMDRFSPYLSVSLSWGGGGLTEHIMWI
ncbi:uncharacterized protein LOC131647484 [Vicia villosa]|uniref:uncharacterized protein LOC131647484 n=1 Tax=Vicia villosa TaxID=3911 RepID=UPI00273CCAF7|nr:uncharacterized protein LOC131647484 [Vicia villosa]